MGQRISDILEVLSHVKQGHRQGVGSATARRAAINHVATARRVKPETIRAACVRGLRPTVRDLTDFDHLLKEWLEGDSRHLQAAIVSRTSNADELSRIRRFFQSRDAGYTT